MSSKLYLEDMFSLKNKTAVIIGGGGVLAGEMALGLSHAGANIVIIDLNLKNCQAKANQIKKMRGKAIAIQSDASVKADIEASLEIILQRFGKVDILINAPGINSATPFFDIQESEWQRILDVNLKSIFNACQVFGQKMIQQKSGGSIINISSVSSEIPLSRVFTYSVSKAGINNITRFLARELAPHNIRVNAVIPGFFPAKQNRKILVPERIQQILNHTPMRRFGNKSELIGAILWLASENASGFVTGAMIHVDGGFSSTTI